MWTRTRMLGVSVLVLQGACATPQSRCSEYDHMLSNTHMELEANDLIHVERSSSETSAVAISEEAALLSKRLKTLCDLLWAQRIPYRAYRVEVKNAYSDYERTRELR